MGTKISKKKFVQYIKAGNEFDKNHFLSNGGKPLFLRSWTFQNQITGLTERENWYIFKHYGDLCAKYGDGEDKMKYEYKCGNCKYYDRDECYCQATGKHEMYDEDYCDGWTDPDDVELTDEEKRGIKGDRKAHEIMVEGREIE